MTCESRHDWKSNGRDRGEIGWPGSPGKCNPFGLGEGELYSVVEA